MVSLLQIEVVNRRNQHWLAEMNSVSRTCRVHQNIVLQSIHVRIAGLEPSVPLIFCSSHGHGSRLSGYQHQAAYELFEL